MNTTTNKPLIENSTEKLRGKLLAPLEEFKPMLIIGIAGPAESGKNLFADLLSAAILEESVTCDPLLVSFASPIKQMLAAGLGLQDKDPRAEEIYGKTYRELAQTLGTDWGRRMVGESIWVHSFIESYKNHKGILIVTDVRFANEARFIRSQGGAIIHMRRPNHEKIKEAQHISEAGISMVFDMRDCLVTNDSDIDHLKKEAESLTSHIFNWIEEDAEEE